MSGTKDPLALSARLARSERKYMARWLALEVLMTDEHVIADVPLWERLSELQEKWEMETMARLGAAR